MSIKVYTGRMGSGKTYEVVSVVILGALSKGRRVVTNIAGMDYPAIVALLEADGIPADCVGELVQVPHDAVMGAGFWRTDETEKTGEKCFIQPGDLLVLDEVWRFWEGFSDRKMPAYVMNFFRMHRHFVNEESGFTCDVAIITQDIMDIARRVRAVTEETYVMTKLTVIGSSRRYRVDIYSGYRLGRAPLRSIQRTYDEKFFPLYQSHSQKKEGGADVHEDNIDGRGNIFNGLIFKLLPLGFLVLGYCIWYLYRFFNPAPVEVQEPDLTAVADMPTLNGKRGGSPSPSGMPRGSAFDDGVSTRWRLVGVAVDMTGRQSWMLSDGSALRVLYDPPAAKFQGWQMSLETPEGEIVTSWSGAHSEKERGLMP